MEASHDILLAVNEIRDLLRLLAEPAIAERDRKSRLELKRLVGNSAPKANAVFLMDGERTQSEIHQKTNVNRGHLSTLVGQLVSAKLLVGDPKKPRLALSIPINFFEKEQPLEQ